jgi:rfaE bifunctional protein nucleotidyltransferase chain/domain
MKNPTSKIHSETSLQALLESWKRDQKKVVFTNGVFDILHKGHVTYLVQAAQLGEALVVGLNADASVKRLNKGEERPLNKQADRAFVLSALECVSAVIIFEEDTPLQLIRKIKPMVLVKGGDYDPNAPSDSKAYIVGSDVVKAYGGQVISIPLVEGYSTTNLVRKMKRVSDGKS